jgi:hypothetical protein
MILINITSQSFIYMSKYYIEIKFKTIHIYMKEWNKVEGIDKNPILRPTQERQP